MGENDPTRLIYRHARDIDRLLGYFKRETVRYVHESQQDPKDWERVGDLERLRDQLLSAASFVAGKESKSIDDLIGHEHVQADEIRTPERMPPGYGLDHVWEDLIQLHRGIDTNVVDGYAYLVERDYEMAGTAFGDAADLQDVSRLVQEGEFSRAWTHASGLDTAVRDEIPIRLYDFLYQP